MNEHIRKLGNHACAIVLLTTLVAASIDAQEPETARAESESSGWLFRVPQDATRVDIDAGLIRQLFTEAWHLSGVGTNGRESVVLIFRMADGTYTGKYQGLSNEYKQHTFRWNPAAIAIVHTHPNGCDPRPSHNDERIAEEYNVRMFTITLSGMYMYDPATKKSSKVVNGLDWLDITSYPEGPRRWFAE